MDDLTQLATQRAAHLMWLERQIVVHRRWQGWLMAGWGMTAAGVVVLFGVIVPFLRRVLTLPDEVTMVLILGVGVEIIALAYITWRVTRRRRELEHEYTEMMQ